MAGIGPATSGAPTQEMARSPRRRLGVTLILAVVVAACAGLGTYLSLRPEGPPEAPARLQAVDDLCVPPQCERFTPTVEIRWRAPETGDPVTGYSILRDGEMLTDERLGVRATSFVDEAVVMNESYSYEVVAHSESGNSPTSATAEATLPLPPLRLARLDGAFTIDYRVERATNLGTFFGIRRPERGDRTSLDHVVYSVCASGEAACPTRWILGTRPLAPKGLTYQGAFVDDVRARCFGGARVPVRVKIDLKIRDAEVSGSAWRVTAFSGTHSISFHCPGSLTSTGSLSMRARA